MKTKTILINQVTGPLFIDIANEYIHKYDNVILVTGSIECTSNQLNPKIEVVKRIKYRRNKSYLRIVTWLGFFFQSMIYLLPKQNIKRVLLVSNPPVLPFVGELLRRKKVAYDILIYDVYPDVLINMGFINTSSLISKKWDRVNKNVYKNSNRLFTISSVMKKVISRTASLQKIQVVYPWVDTSFIKPLDKESNWFATKYNLVQKKVILYSGNMGLTHDLLSVLKVAELMKENSEFVFMLIGDGVQKDNLISFAKDRHLTNVIFLPYQDAEVLPFSFAAADFGLVSLGLGAEGLSVPSKTFYKLSAGCAIISISEQNSELYRIIDKFKCGKSFLPGEFAEISNYLMSLSDSDLLRLKNNSREASKYFTSENAKLFL